MAEFETPEFLENYSVDEIYQTMLAILPPDIDTSEGSHTWNLTRPTAIVAAEICEYILPQVIQLIFPDWSYGEFLDEHAKTRGMTRKAATAATGELTITGAANTVIPAGSVFSTASLNNEDPSISYQTTASATIPSTGSVTVDIVCQQTGTIGNTNADTIILVSSTLAGITAVSNPEATTGGTDVESDEDLIARIDDYDRTQDASFIGNAADYKRWAMSVDGVGNASIIPAQDDTGLVTIVLTDTNGDPATEQLCTNVYNYIMSPDNPNARLAPINAYLLVEAPGTIAIGIKATVELIEGYTIEAVQDAFYATITSYLTDALSDQEIKITRVAAILSATEGVNDFTDLQIGIKNGETVDYGTSNIAIGSDQLPTVSESDLILTEGTV